MSEELESRIKELEEDIIEKDDRIEELESIIDDAMHYLNRK